MSEKAEHEDNTHIQWTTFGNRFAEVVKKSNRRWRKNGALPPKKLLTDNNIRRFLAATWTKTHNKKTTQSAKSYISWALKTSRLPPFIKEHEHHYVDSWKYYKTLKKDKRWSGYSPNAAEALHQDEVRKIAASTIRDHRGRVRLDWLRQKVAAFSLIHMGWHPMDCFRANWTMCKEIQPRHNGRICPAIQINGHATKRRGQAVRNYWACGCQNEHDEENDMCEYGLVKRLVASLGEDRANVSLFWTTNNGGFGWGETRQKKDTISGSIQKINKRVGVRPGAELTGNMGRKTFCTLGSYFFNFSEDELKKYTHHKTNENFIKYLDPTYVNAMRETLITRVFQQYEQGNYQPPLSNNLCLSLANVHEKLEKLTRLVFIVAAGGNLLQLMPPKVNV